MSAVNALGRVDGTALVAGSDGTFSLQNVTAPGPGRDNIVVDVAYSGVSIGTEFGVLRGKIGWGEFPMITGYMASGTVRAVGSDVEGFFPGDRVYVRHNEGLALADSDQPLNCCSGLHCSIASLDPRGDHRAALLPAGVAADVGCLFTVLSVGLYGVDMAGVAVGSTVVVIGLGTIGLAVVAAAAARGALVVGVDTRQRCCEVAESFGAWQTVKPGATETEKLVREIVGESGADFVFEATGLPHLVDFGIALTRPFGAFVWQGHYGEGPVAFDFVRAHHKRLRMFFPCDDGFGR
ncbi:MAG: Alcohol dehydrogenase, zinc-binding domain protein, partial [Acidimicrobiaceae bacterium]|nr:Alcohol dehydrogenase, zinc-binding domain protein [Acidimicrobiaceae bacterium]